ncbi:MAG: hypothetical protein AUG51_09535 [Acidobacteria bacterium 13_1_20CM_3_53_8]|nr:MAG: hypothetical protein AUG51_09535 [Acidobacteria bacterium 13_1_20CM_3_53_8]
MKKLLAAAILLLSAANVFGQQSQPSPEPQTADVLRINTELVQTDVMVFDRQGRFVDNLTRDQFELRVDGKPQSISFFDRLRAGSASEEAQLAAARGISRTSGAMETVSPLDTGRTLFFVVDDLHLSRQSIERARRLLLHFIDNEMRQNDQVAVLSTSGEVGLLQQLTTNKVVLRAAVERLNFRAERETDLEEPRMSEYQAFNIIEKEDYGTLSFFAQNLAREYNVPFQVAVAMAMGRAREILQRSSVLNTATLSVLENFARSSAQLPGRKLAFFISDGFSLSHTQAVGANQKMRRITASAARSGLVIYTLDARGLIMDAPGTETALIRDETNLQARTSIGNIASSQESLRTLADETGGRAMVNTNALGSALTRVLEETASYYLLAWRPEPNSLRAGRAHRIEVSVKGSPDLTVRLRKNYYEQEAQTPPTSQQTTSQQNSARRSASSGRNARAATPESELAAVLRSFYPRKSLPTSLSLGFLDLPSTGLALTTTAQIDTRVLNLDSLGEGQKAIVDVAVAVFDGQDRYVSGYKQQFTIEPRSSNSTAPRRALLNRQFAVAPGLYQVRVAAREEQSGRTGSAVEWIEVPNLSQGKLALSALFVGEPATNSIGNDGENIEATRLVPNRRFSRDSRLRFVTYIYNSAHAAHAEPDLALQVQVFRDDQPVITAPLHKVTLNSDTDLARIPYAAEVPLANLPVGRYVLQVSVIDRIARASATQRINFVIE